MSGERVAWLDTNVVVRLLTGDGSEADVAAARALIAAAESGRMRLRWCDLVFAECVYTLSTFYRSPRPMVRRGLDGLLARPGIVCASAPLLRRTLDLWVERPGLHFVDCYLIVSANAGGDAVATLDGGIARSGLVPVLDGSA